MQMTKEITKQDHEWIERLKQAVNVLRSADDAVHAEQMQQMVEKMEKGYTTIAFCGHFSAGKSTLVNTLCGHTLLPSSPIPTSANVVTIRNGEEEGAWIHRKVQGTAQTTVEQVPLQELDAYCVNGEDIETVELVYPISLLGERGALLDTPGIDSTDDAHRMATQSAMHLADVVFYVMDYNHVQSEINATFMKELKDWGKPLYCIVNMIDKHREQELSFADYRQGVADAFAQWYLEPEAIFFTTLREADHPHNEYDKLRWTIENIAKKGEALKHWTVYRSVHHIMEQHGERYASRFAEEREQIEEEIAADPNFATYMERFEQLQVKQSELEQLSATLVTTWRGQVTSLLDNANVMPAKTRDLASQFIESKKPGFKVGLFFSAGKTAQEVKRREGLFFDDLVEQVDAHIVWHVRDILRRAYAEVLFGSEDAEAIQLREEIDALATDFTADWLSSQIHSGAGTTGEYTIVYCNQVASAIKQNVRREAFELIDRLGEMVAHQSGTELEEVNSELQVLSGPLEKQNRLDEFVQMEKTYVTDLLVPFADLTTPSLAMARRSLPNILAYENDGKSSESMFNAGTQSGGNEPYSAIQRHAMEHQANQNKRKQSVGTDIVQAARQRLKQTSHMLDEASALIRDLGAMKSITRAMEEKSRQLQDNRFTIALFGAFSAGKSSFSNALMGESILPVSPNPTTAAINKIVPPTEEWPHGTAKIKMKSADTLFADIEYSLQVLGYEVGHMDEALSLINKLEPASITAAGKPHLAFLQAVVKGWANQKDVLGDALKVDVKEFQQYVAEESRSCFVEWIELHHASQLAEQGIVLVDTPGADSVNARHTEVAFDYIKNADAVLFVTYYNHAFSQADREFLYQLGRVKDSFSMDKMFFIINAADLAATEEELEGVIKHLEDNLLTFGIREPRIYPISSHLAIDGKLSGDETKLLASNIERFEQDFFTFTLEELADLAIASARGEIHRAKAVFTQWLESARAGEAERHAALVQLEQASTKLKDQLIELHDGDMQHAVRQEISELIYYLKQRLFFRFNELFQQAFNPATLTEGEQDRKQLLSLAWQSFNRIIRNELEQEVLAMTLRIENNIRKQLTIQDEQRTELIKQSIPSFDMDPYTLGKIDTFEHTGEVFPQLPVQEKMLHTYFKNGRQFFEGDGRTQLRSALESYMQTPVNDALERIEHAMHDYYAGKTSEAYTLLVQNEFIALKDHVDGLRAALEMKLDLEEIAEKGLQLERILSSHS